LSSSKENQSADNPTSFRKITKIETTTMISKIVPLAQFGILLLNFNPIFLHSEELVSSHQDYAGCK
jgi:hypothetical protein